MSYFLTVIKKWLYHLFSASQVMSSDYQLVSVTKY